MTYIIILGLSAFLFSLLGTRLLILALRRRNVLLDRPNERSNHVAPTPRGGGLAVVFALIICLVQVDFPYGPLFSMLLLAAVSLLDDLITVPPLYRLMVQILAVSVPVTMLEHQVVADFLPLWLDKLIIGAMWVWFINLFNFMDGIDGISATEMIGIGLGICLVMVFTDHFPNELFNYGMILAAAACGFMWWNWHPARIFLGDVGSVPIGFFSFYILLLLAVHGYVAAALILPAYYVSDASITLARRLYKRKKIWQAHSEHYYQKAVRGGRSHDSVSRYIFGMNLLLIMLAILSTLSPENAATNVAMAYASVFLLLGSFAHTKKDATNEPF